MCNGCITCGYSTRLGSGNNRTKPENVLTSKLSSAASHGFIARLPLDFNRRQFNWRVEPNLRNELRIQLDPRELLVRRGDLGKARIKFRDELPHIDPFAHGTILLQIPATTAVDFASTPNIAVPEVVQSDRRLNQPLVKQPQFAAVTLPQVFPDLVGFKKLAGIEISNALQVKRIVLVRIGSHGTCSRERRFLANDH